MKSIRTTLAEVADVDIYIDYFPFLSGMRSQTMEINLTGPNLYKVARLAEELKTQMQQQRRKCEDRHYGGQHDHGR